MKEIFKLALALMCFAAVACVGLAFVYASTGERIAANQTARLNAALKDIFGEDAVFEEIEEIKEIEGIGEMTGAGGAVSFGAAYRAEKGNALAGIALNVSAQGFNDAVTALVGIGIDGRIAGVRILKNTDTPGLGANASSPSYFVDKPANTKTFYGQFAGMAADGSVKVTKDGGQVEAITAATITSRAVSLLVSAAGERGREWFASREVSK
jgi:electron transport complex protein RnfG